MGDTLRLHHHAHEDNFNDLKFVLLYFDKIEVPIFKSDYLTQISPNSKKYRFNQRDITVTENYKAHIKILQDEKILTLIDQVHVVHQSKITKSISELYMGISKLVGTNFDRLFKNSQQKILHQDGSIDYEGDDWIDELKLFHSRVVKSGISVTSETQFIYAYTVSQIVSILNDINEGKLTLTTSDILDSFVKEYFLKTEFKNIQNEFRKYKSIETNVAFEALQISLPNISVLPFEEILDIRRQMRDELESFRYEIKKLTFSYSDFSTEKSISNILNEYVRINISPRVVDLERKLLSMDQKFLKNVLSEIKDPKSYSPLLLSMFNNISNTLILLVSMGLITFNSALDYYSEKKELKSDGLYFLAKLKQITR